MKLKKKRVLILIFALLILSVACTDSKQKKTTLTRTDFLMDTVMTVRIFDNASEELMNNVFNRIREIEEKMSVTLDTSDVNLINQNAGINPVKIDKETYFVLKKAKEYAVLSDGYYDPTIGPLVELWDVKSSDKERDSIPSEKSIKEAISLVDYKKLELLDEEYVFLNGKNMKLNISSIVKGYAADQARKVLNENGVKSAIIDLGGNVYAYGDKMGSTWKIGIQDPNEITGVELGILNIKDKSIVSSGSYERYFIYKGTRYHHILNPKTGYPSENELIGVTIVSDQSIDGDALSTCMYVAGIEEGKRLISGLDGIQAIFITSDDEVYIPRLYRDEEIFTDLKDKFKLKSY